MAEAGAGGAAPLRGEEPPGPAVPHAPLDVGGEGARGGGRPTARAWRGGRPRGGRAGQRGGNRRGAGAEAGRPAAGGPRGGHGGGGGGGRGAPPGTPPPV